MGDGSGMDEAAERGNGGSGLARRTCLAGLGGLAAWAAWPSSEAQASAPDQKLLIAAYPAVDKIVKAALPAFKALHPGIEVSVVSRQFDDHHTAMTTALTTASNLPDVMTLEVDYLGRFARGIGLEDLSRPPYNVLQDRPRFVPYAFDQATDRTGAVLAVPTDIGPGTLLYRADLMAKAGVYEAELTASWDGYVAAGAKLKAATGARLLPHAREIKDIVIRAMLQPGEGLFFDRQGRALAATPRFHRAFELALKVRQQGLDAKGVPWSSDWAENFKRGGVASVMIGAWMAGHLNNWLAPGTRGQWRTAQLPEGAFAASGGTFYAIPRRANPTHKRAAWDFIRMMTLGRAQQLSAFKSEDAFPALLEAFDDPFFEQPIDFLGGQAGRTVWREAARRIQAVPVHKQDSFAGEVINTELDKVLNRGKRIDTALADAQRLIQARALR